MGYAAGLLGALLVVALILLGAPHGPAGWALTGGSAVGALLIAWRLRAVGPEGAPYARAGRHLAFQASLAPHVIVGSGKAIGAILSADLEIEPQLVKLKTRPMPGPARAAMAAAMAQTPGVAAVDAEEASQLVHVLREHDVDPAGLAALERGALSAAGGPPP